MDGWTYPLWPIHLKPKPDELLSSWIVRLARAHGMKVQTFCQMMFGREQAIWNRDIDKLAPTALLDRLCELTGATREQAWGATLQAYEGILFERHNPFGHTQWILPLGIYHRTRKRFGLLYCPLCLKEDDEPYFRKQWRLAFHLVCDQHGTLMSDRCPSCGMAVVFFRRELGHRSALDGGEITRCHACGFDLRHAPAYDPPSPDGQVLAMLRSLIMFRDIGWWFAGNQQIPYSHLFFDVFHHLAVLIGSKAGRKLRGEIERRTGIRLPDCAPGNAKLEMRSFWERYWLIVVAHWLLQYWPRRFVDINLDAGMSSAWVLRGEHLPWWFEQTVRENLTRATYAPCEDEVAKVAEYLSHCGQAISRKAIGRILGGSDYKATKMYAAKHASPWPRTTDEFDRLINTLNRRQTSLKEESMSWLLGERDRLAIILMRTTGWGAKRVLGIKLLEVRDSLQGFLLGELAYAIDAYLSRMRTALLGVEGGKFLFVGRKRDGVSIDALALRVRKLHRMSFADGQSLF